MKNARDNADSSLRNPGRPLKCSPEVEDKILTDFELGRKHTRKLILARYGISHNTLPGVLRRARARRGAPK
jgi:hypothetical protein